MVWDLMRIQNSLVWKRNESTSISQKMKPLDRYLKPNGKKCEFSKTNDIIGNMKR